MQDVSSIDCQRGSTSIGLVITIFFLVIFVIFPLQAMALEMKAFDVLNQKVVLASELAAIDLVLDLSPESLSEGAFGWRSTLRDSYEILLRRKLDHLTCEITPENIEVNWNPDEGIPALNIRYTYIYTSQLMRYPELSKEMQVEFQYELPMDF
ncbi:MAG: hypothetical protein K8R73_15120 [Clostridiales bacterium]|nr:hypothetical protein [Clostridiales bacterium]